MFFRDTSMKTAVPAAKTIPTKQPLRLTAVYNLLCYHLLNSHFSRTSTSFLSSLSFLTGGRVVAES